MQPKARIAIAAALLVLVAAAPAVVALRRARTAAGAPAPVPFGEQAPSEVTMSATRKGVAGVDPGTAFELTAQKPLDAAQVQQQLTVRPAVPLRVTAADAGGRKFTVAPASALQPGKVYRFSLAAGAGLSRAYGWSFQTRAAFAILGTLPRDQGSGVPVNTGIEFTFSHDDYSDIDPFFEITPAVSGRFERHGRTAVFVPKAPLQAGAIYTVTLNRGLKHSGGEELAADYHVRFETAPADAGKTQDYVYVPTEPQEFAVGDAPYLQVYANKEEGPEAAVAVYRYPDARAYIGALSKLDAVPWWAQYSRSQTMEDVAGLQQATRFSGKPQRFAGIPSPYLVFPAPLPPGYYLAELKLIGITRQVHFQVTDISSYTVVTSTSTLVWLNDLTTKAPIAGASVQLSGGAGASTDAGGVAVLATPPASTAPSNQGVYLQVRAGSKEAVAGAGVPGHYRSPANTETAELYWKYLYLDRSLYKPNDKVGIWGVLAPREPGAAPIATVTAEVIRNEYVGPDNRPLPLASATVPVRDGTFTGSLDLPGLRPGWYMLQVRQGDSVLTSRSFEVANYAKPAYRIEASASKAAVFAGEPVQFRLQASFFEGTPVPNLPIDYSISWTNGVKDGVTTDATGAASVRFTPSADGGNDYGYPNTTYLYAHVGSPEVGEITAGAPVQVFSRNVLFEPNVAVQGGQAVLTAQFNQVVLDRLNAGTSQDYRGGPAAGLPVKGTLMAVHWNQLDAGEAYDFIAKRVYKQYRYEQAFKQVATWSATSDASGQIEQRMTIDPQQSYQLVLQTQDGNGRPMRRELSVSGYQYAPPISGYHWYHLQAEDQRSAWGLGAPVSLVLRESQGPLADRRQGFLFFTARRGLQEYRVQDSPRFAYALKPSDLPYTAVRSVYFDGRMYREAGEFGVRFDPKERELQVSVTPDKPVYRPGDTVNLAVRVTDRNGQPVRGQVNLNLVDEALYALRDEQVDLLHTLYNEWIPSGVLSTHHSHNLPEPGSGAEKGGDGGGLRKDFRDAIFFNSVTTDADGRASATFQVPDNLTSWRITYQAIEPRSLQAASGTTAIPVKLPFFVHLVLGDTYLAGDKPVARVTSFGAALQEGQQVEYDVQVTAPDGTTQTAHASGAAFAAVGVPLPQLKAGTYQVTVQATAPGGLQDGLQQKLAAVDSYLRTTKIDYYLLQPDTKITGAARGLTTLTFTDHPRSRYLALLRRLQWQWGDRLEQQLSRTVSGELLKQYFGEQGVAGAPLDSFSFQAPDGSVAILPYADGTVELSALAADLAPQRFDRAALELYLQKLADTPDASQERKAAALYGLAAIDRPMLLSVQTRLQAPDLSSTEQLYLGLAAASLGELEGARDVYRRLLGARGEQIGNTARLKVSESPDEILSATALMGVLAAKLGEPQAPAFAGYLLTNQPTEVLLSLEEALLAAHGLRQLSSEPAAFTYTLDGKTVNQPLEPGTPVRISVTAQQLAGLRISDVTGQVGVTASYEAPLGAAAVNTAGYKVSRTYAVGGKPLTGALKPGDLVEVTLRAELPASAPGGGYEVTDYLPSGLRLVQRPQQYGVKPNRTDPSWPIQVDGQRASFWVEKGYPITYYARVASPGAYTAEQPVLSHTSSGTIFSTGERQQVTIK